MIFPKLNLLEEFEDYWNKTKEEWVYFFKEEAVASSEKNSKVFLVSLNEKDSIESIKAFVYLLSSITKAKKISSKNKEKIKQMIVEKNELQFLFKLVLRRDFFKENINDFGMDEKWLITKRWKKEYKRNLRKI